MRSAFALAAVTLAFASAACQRAPSPAADASTGNVASQAPLTSKLVARFDAAAGELPEGLVVTSDAAYVGFAPTSRIVRVDTATGTATAYGQLPTPVAGKGFMTGLAQSAGGEIYAGLASFVPEVQAGVYRISKDGGQATLFAKDAALPFPNALAFDSSGALFVTDSGTGSIFRIASDGRLERWATGDALSGDKDACGGAGPGFAIGANGMLVESDAVYVVNTDKATLLKIPRDAAGHAGAPLVIGGPDCDTLGGADGLARAPDGSFIVAINRQNKIVRVAADGSARSIVSGAPFDFPASVAYRGDTLFATNFALKNASMHKPASPGLVEIGR
jgi:sugar lactone lactonase YvrE